MTYDPGDVQIDTTTQERTSASDGTLAAAIYDAWKTRVFVHALQPAGYWLASAVSRNAAVAAVTLSARTWAAAVANSIASGVASVADTLGVTEHNDLTDRDAASAHPAAAVAPDVGNFDGLLSASDDTLQKALDTLDDVAAADIGVNADGFAGNLSPADDTVQLALETIDGLSLGGLPSGSARQHIEYVSGAWAAVNDLICPDGHGLKGITPTSNGNGSHAFVQGGDSYGAGGMGGNAYLKPGTGYTASNHGESRLYNQGNVAVVRVNNTGIGFNGTAPIAKPTLDSIYDGTSTSFTLELLLVEDDNSRANFSALASVINEIVSALQNYGLA